MRARGLASGPTSGHHFICAFWPFHFCRSALIVVRAIARWRQRRRNTRRTVAGCTSVAVARHEAVHLVSSAIVKRCEPVNITRLRCSRLFAAASCCLRSWFSATSDARERNCRTTNPTRAPSIAAGYQEGETPRAGSARFQKVARTGAWRNVTLPKGRSRQGAPPSSGGGEGGGVAPAPPPRQPV